VCVSRDAEHVLYATAEFLVDFLGTYDYLGIEELPLQYLYSILPGWARRGRSPLVLVYQYWVQ